MLIRHKPLLYYSTSTYLSYHINTQFYGEHFLWCSPVFDPTALEQENPLRRIPASSSPKNIYYSYLKDIDSQDDHSALIAQNRAGILRGATFKLSQNIIDRQEYAMINKIVERAKISDFQPVLYVMPEHLVAHKMVVVDVELTANPLSTEYQIKNLVKGEFELIKIN